MNLNFPASIEFLLLSYGEILYCLLLEVFKNLISTEINRLNVPKMSRANISFLVI